MKIIHLEVENFKRITAVDFTPDGDGLVEIGGRNAQGKTSVLDAIQAALARIGKEIIEPIRAGEERARVRIDLGDVIVQRTWSGGGRSVLRVTTAEGASINSPAKLLASWVGQVSFDPLEFANARPEDQVKMLLSVITLPPGVDLDALDVERQQVYDQRTQVNRDTKALQARLDGRPKPDSELPAEPQSTTALMTALLEIKESISLLNRLRTRKGELEEEIRQCQEKLVAVNAQGRELSQEIANRLAGSSVEDLERQARNVEDLNTRIMRDQETRLLAEGVREGNQHSAKLSSRLLEIAKERRAALAAAGLPHPGLEFDREGVKLNGTPFSQASAAERLRISTAIAMAANPDLRVISIRDGSLLDDDGMTMLRQLAEERGFQIWIERVKNTNDGVGLFVEDGRSI